MPTYRMRCSVCGDYEEWASMSVGAPTACPDCGRDVMQVLTPPHLYAVGNRGERTRDIDATEKQWGRDLPAYKRLRNAGYQPQGIDGADHLEATATSVFEINSGGIVKGPERQIQEAMGLAAESTWTKGA